MKETIDLNSNSRKSKFVAKGKNRVQETQKNPSKIKSKGGSKIFQKFGKKVVAATIGDYLVNPDLWTISSLNNRLFDNKNNMLNSSRCLDFSNGKCMYF